MFIFPLKKLKTFSDIVPTVPASTLSDFSEYLASISILVHEFCFLIFCRWVTITYLLYTYIYPESDHKHYLWRTIYIHLIRQFLRQFLMYWSSFNLKLKSVQAPPHYKKIHRRKTIHTQTCGASIYTAKSHEWSSWNYRLPVWCGNYALIFYFYFIYNFVR